MKLIAIFRRNPFVLPMAVVAAFAIFFISEGSYWQSQGTLDSIRGIAVASQHVERLERSLADAENGQRGFLLTGRTEYLAPYQDARQSVGEALQELDRYFATDQVATAQLLDLRELAERKLAELDETVRLARAGNQQTAIELVLSGIGKQEMDSLRRLTNRIVAQQAGQRDNTDRSLDQTLLISRFGVMGLCAVLLLALVLYLQKSDALATIQDEQQRLTQAANDRLEIEVAQRTAQLTDLTRHLLSAREDERHRLARNLHDDLGSVLTAAKLDAARVRARLGDGAPEAQARLADLVDKLNSGIALGRRIIEDLRPSTLSHLGLVPTLEILMRDFTQRSDVQVHCQLDPVHLTPSAELVVYRVVQEAVTNLSKYAQARNLWLIMGAGIDQPDRVEVSVRDDGIGFDAQAPTHSTFGLLGMRFRVESEGGTLQVHSRPGHGTRVSVCLPALVPAALAPAGPAGSDPSRAASGT